MSSFAAVALALAQRGFAVISIDYRCEGALRVKGDPTSNFHPWYDAVEDARAAVRWLKADASRLSVDTARITAFGGSAGAVTVAQLLHALPDSVPMPQLPPPALAPTLCAQALEKACPLPQFTTDAECLTCTRLHAARPVCSPAHRQSWCNKCCRRGRSSTGAAPPLPAPSARGGGNITCGIALSGAIIPASIAAEQVTASAASAGYLDIHGTNDSTVPYDWALARGDNETWGDAVDTRAWLTAGGASNFLAPVPGAGHAPFEAVPPCKDPSAFGCWNGTFFGFLSKELKQEAVKCPAKTDDAEPNGSYDVVVYGATSGGVIAAVAAARAGATVALLDPGTRIGGMSAGDKGHSEVIGGMASAFYMENAAHYNMTTPEYLLEPHVALEIFHKLVADANVSLFSSAPVAAVAKTGARLTSLTTVDGRTFTAAVFIEADYEGDLMARANVSYTIGREGVAKYNESLNGVRVGNEGHEFCVAVDPFVTGSKEETLPMVNKFDTATSVPGQADKKVQSYNFRLCVSTDPANKRGPFAKPVGYDPTYWELARRYFTIPKIARCVRAPSGNVAGCRKDSSGEWYQPEQDDFRGEYSEGMKDHRGADLNNGGPISTDFVGESWTYPDANYTERAKIVDAHKLYTQSFLWFMSTDPALNQSIRTAFQKFGLCKDEFTETDNWPPNLYVRAARRLLGDAVFNQNTPSLNRSWGNESIGCGSYNFDSHTAERIACPNATACRLGPAGDDDAPAAPVAAPVLLLLLYLLPLFMLLVLTPRPKGIALSTGYAWMEGDVETGPGVYDIPMWVLLPRASEATNLLVVASPSASHIGMSTLRMEPQFMIMGQSAGVIAALAIKTVLPQGKPIHEVDTALLHQRLLYGKQLMNEACGLPGPPGPPAPPAPHVAQYTVAGAGSPSCNGVYKYDPTIHRDPGTAFYTKDGHQIYRSGGVWRIAHGLASPDFLWYTSTTEGGTSPPSSGWKAAGKGVAPAPTLK